MTIFYAIYVDIQGNGKIKAATVTVRTATIDDVNFLDAPNGTGGPETMLILRLMTLMTVGCAAAGLHAHRAISRRGGPVGPPPTCRMSSVNIISPPISLLQRGPFTTEAKEANTSEMSLGIIVLACKPAARNLSLAYARTPWENAPMAAVASLGLVYAAIVREATPVNVIGGSSIIEEAKPYFGMHALAPSHQGAAAACVLKSTEGAYASQSTLASEAPPQKSIRSVAPRFIMILHQAECTLAGKVSTAVWKPRPTPWELSFRRGSSCFDVSVRPLLEVCMCINSGALHQEPVMC